MIDVDFESDEVCIPLWTVVYDSNPSNVYFFHNYEQVINAIEGAVRGYLVEDSDIADYTIAGMIDDMRPLEYYPCIPIIYGNMKVMVYRWNLDKTNYLYKLLLECYDQVDNDTQAKIRSLFVKNEY